MARKSRASKVQSEEHNRFGHSAQEVANAFVEQYYKILSHYPEHSYKFYRDESILSIPGVDGVRSVTTIKGIDKEIMGSTIKNSSIDLCTVHGQDTVAESVIVVVIGLWSKDNVSKCFSQTFLLAPQARGFYVLNDFFHFIDVGYVNTPHDTENYLVSIKYKGTSTEDKINAPYITQSFSNSQDDVKKSSYASIVVKAKLVKDTTLEAHCEDLEEDQNCQSISPNDVTHIENGQIEKRSPQNVEEFEKKDSYSSTVVKDFSLTFPKGQVLTDINSSIVLAKPSVVPQNLDKTIYVRDLPPQVTRRTLSHAVKRFGSVKHKNIQIRGYADGYRYAFVEFNNLNAAQLAVEAGFINFDDWECQVESKEAHFEGLEVRGNEIDSCGCGCGGNDGAHVDGCSSTLL